MNTMNAAIYWPRILLHPYHDSGKIVKSVKSCSYYEFNLLEIGSAYEKEIHWMV